MRNSQLGVRMGSKAISLFSGAGGMDVGVAAAGFSVVAASEIDGYACETYRANHPSCRLYEGDIKESLSELVAYKDIDLVFGGPPCQGFSVAGRMDLSDPRSQLVFAFCDIVDGVEPKAFILENVKSLATLAKFRSVREEIFRRMESQGYVVSMLVLNAKDFGVPQARERVFFVGIKGARKRLTEDDLQRFHAPAKTLKEAILHLGRAGSPSNPKVTKAKITLAAKPVLRKSPYAGMLFNGQGRPLNPNSHASTLPASMGGNRTPIIDEEQLYSNKPSWVEGYHKKIIEGKVEAVYTEAPSRLRRLTVDEAAILQTFPIEYVFKGPQSSVFSQIGNAVPCKLAEVVATLVRDTLNNKNPAPIAQKLPVQSDLALTV